MNAFKIPDRNIKTGSMDWLRALWTSITRPSSVISGKEEILQIRLLTGLLVTLILLFLIVNISYIFYMPSYGLPAADLVGYVFFIQPVYIKQIQIL